jgi:hypothetical protein
MRPTVPAPDAAPNSTSAPRQEPEEESGPITLSWHISSLELQEGLTVKEEYDTVPGSLFDL